MRNGLALKAIALTLGLGIFAFGVIERFYVPYHKHIKEEAAKIINPRDIQSNFMSYPEGLFQGSEASRWGKISYLVSPSNGANYAIYEANGKLIKQGSLAEVDGFVRDYERAMEASLRNSVATAKTSFPTAFYKDSPW